ncbi:MAG: methyl-viologen-reducing hydrogenase subunit delta [Latescibacteria bacterium DG_63]|uniref:Methyl-viologen-reducing hydrogenase subunit delta n=1 Tax=candidate division TA06 bacterium SM1_40 TaxID=1703773 RepID=A0A0S8JD78_UNCT6|nr:MAG: methyl-viologen-reducing hydrogenase subunit delta [Latescibacteria bacterium DG_63]KPL07346.1 MAG: methyl-viologen-reducing hydrogenase subunit delta [candidate division TA06 bacterium SM1_40]
MRLVRSGFTIWKGVSMSEFEPQILAFCCYHCAFAAADTAGSMRLEYPPNVKVVRFPCTGKVDQTYILRAFENGVDGLFVAG